MASRIVLDSYLDEDCNFEMNYILNLPCLHQEEQPYGKMDSLLSDKTTDIGIKYVVSSG
jgi:hypothetical protein